MAEPMSIDVTGLPDVVGMAKIKQVDGTWTFVDNNGTRAAPNAIPLSIRVFGIGVGDEFKIIKRAPLENPILGDPIVSEWDVDTSNEVTENLGDVDGGRRSRRQGGSKKKKKRQGGSKKQKKRQGGSKKQKKDWGGSKKQKKRQGSKKRR